MKKIIVLSFLFCSFYYTNAQSINIIWPHIDSEIEREFMDDGSYYFKDFDIKITKDKDILYKNKSIYKCEFPDYYEYLIEVFSSNRNYILITPLAKKDIGEGNSFLYSIDRGIVLLFDLSKNKKYYLSFDEVKKITSPKGFEFKKAEPHVFMIKEVDIDNKELILLQGGIEVKEVKIKFYEFGDNNKDINDEN